MKTRHGVNQGTMTPTPDNSPTPPEPEVPRADFVFLNKLAARGKGYECSSSPCLRLAPTTTQEVSK